MTGCLLYGCTRHRAAEPVAGTYGYDAAFLRDHEPELIELTDGAGAQLLVSPQYQGRVMTSTATGPGGKSFGWLNYNLLSAGKVNPQFNPVGGEERFWLGPEGGQYALYFPPGDSFTIGNWKVPALIDTEPFTVKHAATDSVVFTAHASITNYAGYVFSLDVKRSVRLVAKRELGQMLHAHVPSGVSVVAYETENSITNAGNETWSKEKGLISIWLLGMFTPTDQTVVIVPHQTGDDVDQMITTDYFGDIPADRLIHRDSVLLFRCDGQYRSKLGVNPAIAKPIAGSYDFESNVLTLILFPVNPDGDYVNSTWKIQEHPYAGDVVNSYNDGPLADGTQLGPFYELESSSEVRALKPGEQLAYKQVTCHLQGDSDTMKKIAEELLGTDLDEVRKQMWPSQ